MESLHHFQPLDDAGTLLAGGIFQLILKFHGLGLQVNGLQQLLDGLRPHAHTELIAKSLPGVLVLPLGQHLLIVQTGTARIQHNIGGKIQHLLQHPGGQIQNQPHAAGDALKIPDMGYRRSQLNMAHTLPAHTGLGHFHAAAVTDNALVPDLLILAAMTLPVLTGPKYFLAEQAVPLGLQSSVVDSLRLHDLAAGPFAYFFRGS